MELDSDEPCPSSIPGYYLVVLHTIAMISIPLNIFAFWLVWKHSPKKSNYKYCLGYVQIVTFSTEFFMSVICPGYYFFPMLGGINMASFSFFTNPHATMTFFVTIFCFESAAFTSCFIFRHNSAVKLNASLNKRRNEKITILVLNHILPFMTGFSFWKSRLSTEQRVAYLANGYPQCLSFISNPRFVVYDPVQNPWVAVAGIGALVFVLIFGIYGFSLSLHAIHILRKLQKSMSAKTYRIQRTAIIGLTAQVLLPAILLIVPIYFILIVSVYKMVEMQKYATCSTFLIASHSLLSSVVMIGANPKHRGWIKTRFGYFHGIVGRQAPSVSVVVKSNGNNAS